MRLRLLPTAIVCLCVSGCWQPVLETDAHGADLGEDVVEIFFPGLDTNDDVPEDDSHELPCIPDCTNLECGADPICGVECGPCQDRFVCTAGACVDDCLDRECGRSPNLNVNCGWCEDKWWCHEGHCLNDCIDIECGPSPVMQTSCGTCSGNTACSLGHCISTGDMVDVPYGAFYMGCRDPDDDSCTPGEYPSHEVVTSAYAIDRTEVTQHAFAACVDAGECETPACGWMPDMTPDNPTLCVTWHQAATFCAWADKRLPTEAEWERAAKKDYDRIYPWQGTDATCDLAVMNDLAVGGFGCGTGGPLPVCSRSPAGDSPFGACDMAGNVAEWVADWHDVDYYSVSPLNDPTGPAEGTMKVIRGGDYGRAGLPSAIRVTQRVRAEPELWGSYIEGPALSVGFRCARSVQSM